QALSLDVEAAAEHYRQALDLLLADSPRRPALLVKSAEAAARAGRFDDAKLAFERAIQGFESAGDLAGRGEALAKLANLLWHRGETAQSRLILQEAMTALEREPPGLELASTYLEVALDRLTFGEFQQ